MPNFFGNFGRQGAFRTFSTRLFTNNSWDLKEVTAPAAEPISRQELKDQSRVDIADDDSRIDQYIKAARETIEIVLRRTLVTTTLELRLDDFPGIRDVILLPRPPIKTFTSVKYLDTAGVEQTLAASLIQTDLNSEPGKLMPAPNQDWPETEAQRFHTVTIKYDAGYGDASAVPGGIKQAIAMQAAHWYENREAVLVGVVSKEIEFGVTSLIQKFRIMESA